MRLGLKSYLGLAVLIVPLALAGCTQLSGLQDIQGPQSSEVSGSAASAAANHIPVCPGADVGAARCHSRVLIDSRGIPAATTSPTGYVPTQMRHAYGFDLLSGNGAGKTIGIVDAFDDPSIASDLAVFKSQFGISGCNLTKVNQNGGTKFPRVNANWALEISLDVEWACAIAPGANILLVEASTNSFSNLLTAVDYAAKHTQVVSMSWGGSEFSSESSDDFHFNVTGVSFTASSGDNGTGAQYPVASPDVIGVGGTTLPLDSAGNLTGSETAWSGSGGGISAFEAEPAYQSSYPIPNTGGKRGIPDVSYDADPNTGVSVYDTTSLQGQSGWFVVGGTSAGAPQWAALIVLVDQGRTSSLSSNNLSSSPEYNAAARAVYASNYRDITSGTNGSCGSVCTASTGYDFVTGLGSPLANNLVPYLQTH
jgi:subtilase family serine protease